MGHGGRETNVKGAEIRLKLQTQWGGYLHTAGISDFCMMVSTAQFRFFYVAKSDTYLMFLKVTADCIIVSH